MVKKYVLTGGPGTGKTTLLGRLEEADEIVFPEVAREIIAEEREKENGILPWNDLSAFQELVMQRQVKQERQLEDKIGPKNPGRAFFDRSLVDGIAYAEEGGVKFPKELFQLIEQAGYTRIFFLEPLPFYSQDQERKEDFELANKIHQRLYRVYDRLGFDIVMVPPVSIEERVKLILAETRQIKNREIERKYRIAHSQVKEMLERYAVKYKGTDHEENKLYDFHGLLKEAGCVFRIRKNNGNHLLTLKGPNKGVNSQTQNKKEYNLALPGIVSEFMQHLLPESVVYSKQRENYCPLGDLKCTISFDSLPGLGEFVEIEAASENQVLLWEKRLELTPYHITESYPQLVSNIKNS